MTNIMTNTKNTTDRLTKEEILKLLQLSKGMEFALSPQDIAKYKPLLSKKITIAEAFDLIDVGTSGLINLAKIAVRDSKLVSLMATEKLGLTEKDWNDAEAKVDAEEEKQKKEIAKKIAKANKEANKENAELNKSLKSVKKPNLHLVRKDSK